MVFWRCVVLHCVQLLLSRACVPSCACIQPFLDGGLTGSYSNLVVHTPADPPIQIFKIVVPYVILSAAFATLNARLRLPSFSLFLVALTLTDGGNNIESAVTIQF